MNGKLLLEVGKLHLHYLFLKLKQHCGRTVEQCFPKRLDILAYRHVNCRVDCPLKLFLKKHMYSKNFLNVTI